MNLVFICYMIYYFFINILIDKKEMVEKIINKVPYLQKYNEKIMSLIDKSKKSKELWKRLCKEVIQKISIAERLRKLKNINRYLKKHKNIRKDLIMPESILDVNYYYFLYYKLSSLKNLILLFNLC